MDKLPLLLLAAAIAGPAATWRVAGQPGAVTVVVGQVGTGGRIVGDGMVSDPDMVRDEQGFSQSPARPGSCGWASAVRPFTRLRRFAADGRLLWEWRVGRLQQAIRLSATKAGDCLSPDGGRLVVSIYRFAPGERVIPLGEGVVAVDHRPRFVAARGARSHTMFGNARETDLVGWQRGRPATLLFDVVDAAGRTIAHDGAALTGPDRR